MRTFLLAVVMGFLLPILALVDMFGLLKCDGMHSDIDDYLKCSDCNKGRK